MFCHQMIIKRCGKISSFILCNFTHEFIIGINFLTMTSTLGRYHCQYSRYILWLVFDGVASEGASEGAIVGATQLVPEFHYVLGLGWCVLANSFVNGAYYITVITWAFYYLFSSFVSPLPWSHCDQTWNSPGKTLFLDTVTGSGTVWDCTALCFRKALSADILEIRLPNSAQQF